MADTVRAVRFHGFGEPEEVLVVEPVGVEPLGPGQARVRMLAASINPADVNVVQGVYGLETRLPSFVGNEGVGVVRELGEGIVGLEPGRLVRPMPGVGCWRQELVADAGDLLPLPAGLEVEQAASISVNPATAWRLLEDFASLEPGDWVAQNAATSAVGRAVIQICRQRGLRSLNLVRRPGAVAELEALGADKVVLDEGALARGLLDGAPLELALNAVGGDSAGRLARLLGPRGAMVTYGAMGREPLVLANGPLIFKELSFHGFWVSAWYRRAEPAAVEAMLGGLAALYASGALSTQVERRYPMEQVREAVAHSRRGGRTGKILLVL